jgi:hypothetical protein
VFVLIVTPMTAAAQARWEVEMHAGGTVNSQPAAGNAALPAAGTPFTTSNGLPSRRESSWYFGDGAAFVNQVNATRGLIARITPLDSVLTSAVAQRTNGGAVGLRVSRSITTRYAAEFSFDYSRTPVTLTDSALAGIEASRASFTSAFSVPVPAGSQGAAPVMSATSIATIDSKRGSQWLTTGVININLTTTGRVTPFVSAGAGVVANGTDTPSATLVGNYRITGPAGTPMAGVVVHDETDSVTLRYPVDRYGFVGVVGGGVKYAVSRRWGVRLDVRAHLERNGVSNLVDAMPSIKTLTPPTVLSLPANPSLQFSNNPSTGAQSSLAGPVILGFQTFHGTGLRVQPNIVAGVYLRF